MPARIGNKTAEKWTLQATLDVIAKIERYAFADEIPLFSQALMHAQLYPQLWSYLRRKWRDNEDIMERIYRIEFVFENTLITAGIRGTIPLAMVSLIMRTKYGYNDRAAQREEELEMEEDKAEEQLPPPTATVHSAQPTGTFRLDTTHSVGKEYAVYDKTGALVTRGSVTCDIQPLDMTTQPNGVYHLLILGPHTSPKVMFTLFR